MKIGIVSGCISEKPRKFLKKIHLISYDEFIAAELPFDSDELKRMKKRKKNRWMNKAENLLNSEGVNQIMISHELRDEPFDKSSVFYMYAADTLKMAAEYFDISLPLNLYVKQKSPDGRMLSIIRELAYDAKKIGVITDDGSKAEIIEKSVMNEFGEYAEKFLYSYIPDDGIMIDVDEASFLVSGKWKLERFSANVYLGEYGVDSTEFCYLKYGVFDKIKVNICQCGKNKLTLMEK